MPTAVETVEVVVRNSQTREPISTVKIPAYTRTTTELEKTIQEVVDEYMRLSVFHGEPVSLGDFVLFAITKASMEPFEI